MVVCLLYLTLLMVGPWRGVVERVEMLIMKVPMLPMVEGVVLEEQSSVMEKKVVALRMVLGEVEVVEM